MQFESDRIDHKALPASLCLIPISQPPTLESQYNLNNYLLFVKVFIMVETRFVSDCIYVLIIHEGVLD